MQTPKFSINGLNRLARALALLLHGSSGLIRMETIRAVARERRESQLLPAALEQLRGYRVAEVCGCCDVLLSETTHHAPGCAGRKYAAAAVAAGKSKKSV